MAVEPAVQLLAAAAGGVEFVEKAVRIVENQDVLIAGVRFAFDGIGEWRSAWGRDRFRLGIG